MKKLKVCVVTSNWIIKANNSFFAKPQIKFLEFLSHYFDKMYILAPVKKHSFKGRKGHYINQHNKNISIIELPYFRGTTDQIKKLYLIPFIIYKYFKYISKSDIVFIYNRDFFSTIGLIIAKILNKNVVYIIGDVWKNNISLKYPNKIFIISMEFLSLIQKKFLSCKKSNSLILITPSSNIEKEVKDWNLPYSKYFASLISEKDFYYRTGVSFSTKEKINILYVGWLIKGKGVEDLVKAVAELQKIIKTKEIILNIVGDGYFKKNIEILVQKLKINVNFYGEIGNFRELLKIYRNNDIFVLPSYSEGYPKVIFEAASQGLICICSDAVDLEGLCIKYKCGKVKDLVDKLLKIINDDKHINLILEKQYKIAKYYTLEKAIENIHHNIIDNFYTN